MIKTRIATIGLSLALVLGAATPAGAVTVAELQAQINALMAQLASLQGTPSMSAGFTFTQNLTIGSTGAEVVALQQMLVAQGHLVMPVGVSMGYFGTLTQAAVAKWQAANGIAPAVGYFGPISRAKANMTNPNPTPTPTPIGTPGVEGILTATLAPTPGSGISVEEGESKVKVLGVELEADLSDIKIERIKIKLDQTTTATNDKDFYRDIADMMYVMDGSTVLASVELNSSTVVEETSGNFYVTITGLNYVVPKDAERTLTIAIDAQDSWDSDFDDDTWTVTIPTEGVRGVDGAGINQYAPSSGTLARTFSTDPASMDTATLTVSTNVNTPKAQEVIASEGSDEDELDGLEVLRFDVKADDDDVTITDVVVDITTSGSATTTTGYLYDGSTLLASDSIDTDGHAGFTFDDVDFTVSDNSTKTLMVKVDVADAATSATTILADIDTADVTAENSDGDSITESGSATGETITVRKVGIEVSLVSKSITKGATASQNNTSTSTVEAQFTFRVKAVGGDIVFGDAGSTTVPFVSNAGGSHDDGPTFTVYRGGTAVATGGASSTSLTVPSGVVSVTNNSFTIQENNTVDIPVSFTFEGRTTAGALLSLGSYAVGISQLNWVSSAGIQESNFMSGKSEWRTSTVSLP